MSRSRVPQVPAFIHLAIRLGGLAFSIACFYYLLYLATLGRQTHLLFCHLRSKRPSLQLQAYLTLQVSTAIVVDLIEVCGFLDASFTLKRRHVGCLIFGNVVSISLGVIGCLQLTSSELGLSNAPSDYPRPWRDILNLAFILMIPFPIVRLFYSITRVCYLLRMRRREREAWKRGREGLRWLR